MQAEKNVLNILTACSSIKTTSGCRKECKSKLRVIREIERGRERERGRKREREREGKSFTFQEK